MAVTSELADGGRSLTIRVEGKLDYGVHHEFRRAYETAKGPDTHFVVDLSRAEYIDSSGLGMLLMLREHAGGDRSDVRIANATGEVRDILAISNFDRLFRVD